MCHCITRGRLVFRFQAKFVRIYYYGSIIKESLFFNFYFFVCGMVLLATAGVSFSFVDRWPNKISLGRIIKYYLVLGSLIGFYPVNALPVSKKTQHNVALPILLATQPSAIAEEQEVTMTGNLADLTPPPPPGFQDPPHIVRKASLDFSPPTIVNPSSPEPGRMSHHRHHFSTSFLTDIGRLGSNAASSVSDIGGEGSTKSDPLPRMGACEGEGEADVEGGIAEDEKNSKGHQRGAQQAYAESFLSVRQRHRNAAAAAITIPGKNILNKTNFLKNKFQLTNCVCLIAKNHFLECTAIKSSTWLIYVWERCVFRKLHRK